MPCIDVTGELNVSQFEWKIFNFFQLPAEKGFFYKSPSFVFDNTPFHLSIYPKGDNFTKAGFISLYLVNESNCPVHVAYELLIKKADGTLTSCIYADSTLKPYVGMGYIFRDRSALLKDQSELAPSGNLTIVCVMKFSKYRKQVPVKANNIKILREKQAYKTLDYRVLSELDALSENLKELSTNKDSCDVLLKVGENEFKAHRAILMARSLVFAAMFQHDTLEKQTGIIKISDCDSESFQEFLDYLYCGKLEDVSFRSAFHLYYTSKKYDVQELKEFCLENLKENLTIDNVCDIAVLADKYNEAKLMTKVQEFFNANWNKIFPTSEWESLLENNFRVANKLLIALSKTKDS